MKNKEQLLNAVDKLEDEYDAFYFENKYSGFDDSTHAKEFSLLVGLHGDKVENALNWIHQCYDCYYKGDNDETSPFAYLREVINNELN